MLRLETKYLSKNSVEDWYERYIDWMKEYSPQDIGEGKYCTQQELESLNK